MHASRSGMFGCSRAVCGHEPDRRGLPVSEEAPKVSAPGNGSVQEGAQAVLPTVTSWYVLRTGRHPGDRRYDDDHAAERDDHHDTQRWHNHHDHTRLDVRHQRGLRPGPVLPERPLLCRVGGWAKQVRGGGNECNVLQQPTRDHRFQSAPGHVLDAAGDLPRGNQLQHVL